MRGLRRVPRPGRVVRAGLELLGHGEGLNVALADGAGATLTERIDEALEAGLHAQPAGAEGAQEALVPGKRDQVGAQALHIDLDVSERLRGIEEEHGPASA